MAFSPAHSPHILDYSHGLGNHLPLFSVFRHIFGELRVEKKNTNLF